MDLLLAVTESAMEALALPQDDTALKEAIKQAKQEVIDKYEKDVRIKSLKAAKREALLEAAEWFDKNPFHGFSLGTSKSDELRRMAEELK